MKKLIISAFAAFAATAAGAQNSDATLNSVTETYTLNPDGSVDFDYNKSLTYNTQFAFNSLFGETFIVYNPDFQKLKINECYTIQKDGTRIDAPANAFNEVLPSAAANSAAYNGLREMVVTHTGLETGATSTLSYSIKGTGKGKSPLDIDRIIPVQGADIKEYKIVVNLPDGDKKLNWSVEGAKVSPVIKGNTYTWTFRNIPAASGDQYGPANHTGAIRLTATTAQSLAEDLRPMSIETRDIFRLPGVVADTMSTESKIAAVQKFMRSRIATGGVTPDLTGYRLRQCSEVVRSAYGTPAEKAAAMAKILRGEGVDAQMVVVFPKEIGAKNVRSISRYLVMADGKFYDPSREGEYNAAIRADRDVIYDLAGNEVAVAPATVKVDCSATIALSADSVKVISEDCSLAGIDGECSIKAGSVVTREPYMVYTIAAPSKGVDSWGMQSLQSSRKDLFEVPYAIDEKCVYTIKLNGVSSSSESKNEKIENAAGSVELQVVNNGDTVTITRQISLKKSIYSPAEYAAVRALLLKWKSPAFRSIVVK